ncbi:hypothetical protein WJ0W_004632 [Paenibacillus melissococcoides]|uniref:Uncharacterized protein n=1 Tax=Paenibacillus melissococcoides TaxID=2912268 RepID=A0ABN8UD36_9BACL|nr:MULTISPECIES: hypothetical protein [Paenibacillus]MEB9895108.1 hypothetical protein [Bacillus cereus]CAH8247398.1 hypothetical protein WJ0W_004632 [Paenibacillus melissococcoides]CAH8705264.1 hypothetical protein WDD9_000917 [Paenibacillus melissococcoides]CAH8708486.1 hypothetical protein HTL2_002002 [Paenibacillus melissococcoides]GIO79421.1 hypothetical protein J6TS7_30310 [Paenibacillus dendritiformis]
MQKKYEFTGEMTTEIAEGAKLHRIRAIRDFGDVKAGDLGGWIESKHNLSHAGKCWVYDESAIFGSASVIGNAEVKNESMIYDSACVDSGAVIDNSEVFGSAQVSGFAQVAKGSLVYQRALIAGDTKVFNAEIGAHIVMFEGVIIGAQILIRE